MTKTVKSVHEALIYKVIFMKVIYILSIVKDDVEVDIQVELLKSHLTNLARRHWNRKRLRERENILFFFLHMLHSMPFLSYPDATPNQWFQADSVTMVTPAPGSVDLLDHICMRKEGWGGGDTAVEQVMEMSDPILCV